MHVKSTDRLSGQQRHLLLAEPEQDPGDGEPDPMAQDPATTHPGRMQAKPADTARRTGITVTERRDPTHPAAYPP